jgi:hypothetical protein
MMGCEGICAVIIGIEFFGVIGALILLILVGVWRYLG